MKKQSAKIYNEEPKRRFENNSFYWVKVRKNYEFEPARYDSKNKSFFLTGLTNSYHKKDLFEIGLLLTVA